MAIAFFGLTPAMALGVIAFGSIWPMLLATVHGFADVEPRLYRGRARAGHVAAGGRDQDRAALGAARHSRRPAAGLTVALILSVVCEMIAGLDGLGAWELLAARAYRSPDIFAGVMLLGVIGLARQRGAVAGRSPARCGGGRGSP